ncbi:hypothetical protein ACL1E5_02340 [Corynebacterium striatum]
MTITVVYVIAGIVHYNDHEDALSAVIGDQGQLSILNQAGEIVYTYAPGVWKTINQ